MNSIEKPITGQNIFFQDHFFGIFKIINIFLLHRVAGKKIPQEDTGYKIRKYIKNMIFK